MNVLKLFTSFCLAVLLCGCMPEQKVLWAPDGKTAIVMSDEGCWLIDDAGKRHGESIEADILDWHPNSSSMLTIEKRTPTNWEEVAALLDPGRRQDLIRLSEELLDNLEKSDQPLMELDDQPAINLILEEAKVLSASGYGSRFLDFRGMDLMTCYLMNEQEERVNKLATTPQDQDNIENWREEVFVSIYQLKIRSVDDRQFTATINMLESVDPIRDAVYSPDGQSVLFIVDTPAAPTLYVLGTDSTNVPMQVDTKVGKATWSPDGSKVVYSKAGHELHEEEDQLTLGTISQAMVAEAGNLLTEAGAPEDLVAIAFQGNVKPAFLFDGRILFCTAELHLPFSTGQSGPQVALFTVDPHNENRVEKFEAEGLYTGKFDRLPQCVVSPDGSKIALISSTGQVGVLHIKGHRLVTLQPDKIAGYGSRQETDSCVPMVPSWRSNEELCFVVPPGHPAGSADRAEVVLKQEKHTHNLSRTWPDSGVATFLPGSEKQGSPAPE
jgi:hypothetical protein